MVFTHEHAVVPFSYFCSINLLGSKITKDLTKQYGLNVCCDANRLPTHLHIEAMPSTSVVELLFIFFCFTNSDQNFKRNSR